MLLFVIASATSELVYFWVRQVAVVVKLRELDLVWVRGCTLLATSYRSDVSNVCNALWSLGVYVLDRAV